MKLLKWHKINAAMPAHDFVQQISVNGKKLCLVRDHGQLYAMENTCPHAGGTLSGGWCKNGHLVCPVHRWEYDLKTGRGAEGQGDYVNTYPLDIKPDGEVYIGMKENWFRKFFK